MNNSLQTGHVLRIPVKPGPWRITACVPAFRFGFMSVCGTAASAGRFQHRGTRESQESRASLFAVRYPRTCKRTTDDTPLLPGNSTAAAQSRHRLRFQAPCVTGPAQSRHSPASSCPRCRRATARRRDSNYRRRSRSLKCSGPASPGISNVFFRQDSPFDTTRMKQWPRTGFPV